MAETVKQQRNPKAVMPAEPLERTAWAAGQKIDDSHGEGKNPVGMPTARYYELEAKRALPRTLMGGTEAMRKAREAYMPKHPAESVGAYEVRLRNTVLYNGFEDTCKKMAGKLFEAPVVLQDDVPPALVELAKNIDGQGRALTPFMYDVATAAFVDGVSYVLIDMPPLKPGATLADQLAANAVPYWVLVPACELIGWRVQQVGSQQMLVQARIRRTVERNDGDFGRVRVREVLVYEPLRVRRYEWRELADKTWDWVLDYDRPTTMAVVPLVPFYTNRVGFLEGEPPLRSLAELNQEHWVSSSEQRNALSFLRFAMLKVTGVQQATPGGPAPQAIEIGPSKVLRLPSGADAAFIEHSGAGVNSGFEDLKDIERRMQSAGMTIRVDDAGTVAATTTAINSNDSNAALKAVAGGNKDSIEHALDLTARWLRLPEGGTVDVFTDFAGEVIPGTPADIMHMRVQRDLSRRTMWGELQRRGVLSEDFDADAELARLGEDLELDMRAAGGMSEAMGNSGADTQDDETTKE